ncbi:hypothetical protein [Pectobacterium cacticida]|uniref:hypothetical protein n=1 Tax=Pectobacterium cacticida TaxID=69221 RepID=UPI003986132F
MALPFDSITNVGAIGLLPATWNGRFLMRFGINDVAQCIGLLHYLIRPENMPG